MLQIFAAVGLTGYWSWRNGQKAVQELSGQLREEVSDRIEQHLDTYLDIPLQIVQTNANAFEIGLLSPEQRSHLEPFFVNQVRSQDISYVLLGLETGQFVGVGHFFGDERITIDAVDQATPEKGGETYAWATDSAGQRSQRLVDIGPFLAREEGWYTEAVQQGHRVWSPIYNWLVEPFNLSIAVSEPLYSSDVDSSNSGNPKLLGVVAAEQQLTAISRFLQNLEVSPSGQTFIIERTGLLIGSSTPHAPFRIEAGSPQRLNAVDSEDPLIRATAQFMAQQFQDLSLIRDVEQLEFQQDGDRHFVQITPWQDALGLDWLVVVVMPEADFMAQIQANARQTLILCSLALGIATGFGIVTTRWITQPLLGLSDIAEAIAQETHESNFPKLLHPSIPTYPLLHPRAWNFHLRQLETPAIYRFRELARLSQSFHRMAHQLHWAFEWLSYSANHDALTGLPNRFALEVQLEAQLDNQSTFALLFLDLDYFKLINDGLGHAAGDCLLKDISLSLRQNLPPQTFIARFGGDEFVILLPAGLASTTETLEIAKSLIEQLQQPFSLEGNEVFVGASIGIVASTQPGLQKMTLQEAMRNADTALYEAKRRGKGQYVLFDAAMHRTTRRRLELETDLRRAIKHQELELHYQPIVDAYSSQICGFEALIRWPSTRLKKFISPDEFIPIAEETGLILPITHWVLRTACQQMKNWQQQFPYCGSMIMHINVPSQQFLQADWFSTLMNLLEKQQLSPHCLGLEITERTLVSHEALTKLRLQELASAGIHISIDDFGTGYSSLSYLQQYPIHCLKIDRSFVKMLRGRDSDNDAIVRAIVMMARNLNLELIAEGVETEIQHQTLIHLGCQHIQGHWFAPPMPAVEIAKFLSKQAFQRDSSLVPGA